MSMKETGIVRNLDNLGRVTLPIELRRTLNMDIKDPVEIFVHEDSIVLKKYEPSDIFTGSKDDLIEYEGKMVSKKTIMDMAKKAGIKVIS
ncbi:MAG: AbrB/MazE/SpoVT family DNA-binding domain-containing protein [Lachnospiraceae bacterium]|nr:AbrB/MazE/SpoVT family DNA-binding domain-containing protein [Lachnospiraceae bacterium]MDE6625785.1 AbrB/MazE/SpoVT family DNA-binding domain-containing protein [Lachnospiraceae bacterium]